MQETLQFLAKGGPVMIVIGLCSVIALAIFIERLWALQRHKVVPGRFLNLVRDMLAERKVTEARALCTGSESTIGAVLAAGLKHASAGRAVVREAMQDRGRREIADLERYTGALGAIANLAPLLGLLGTILGMIKTFKRVNDTIVSTGQVSPGALANGIWEALITTAAGLIVAIPAFIAFKFIMGRVDRLIAEMEDVSLDMVDLIADAGAEQGMNFRGARRERQDVTLDLTPMIDVVFLLLIFFLVTATFAQRDQSVIPIDLPEGQSGAASTATERTTVHVQSDGAIVVTGADGDSVELDMDSLRDYLLDVYNAHPDRPIRLRGDREADYGVIMEVWDMGRDIGFNRIENEIYSQ